MTYDELLAGAPPHDTPAFLGYLRKHNDVLYEDSEWLVIKNMKYGWPTAFAKNSNSFMTRSLQKQYGQYEWRKKAEGKQTIKRFHFHILSTNSLPMKLSPSDFFILGIMVGELMVLVAFLIQAYS